MNEIDLKQVASSESKAQDVTTTVGLDKPLLSGDTDNDSEWPVDNMKDEESLARQFEKSISTPNVYPGSQLLLFPDLPSIVNFFSTFVDVFLSLKPN